MSRLPSPGSDNDIWGTVLNDYLSVEHNPDGTLKSGGSLAAKANESRVVHNTGDETIAGVKTFVSSPVVPVPVLGSQAANKTYIDSVANNSLQTSNNLSDLASVSTARTNLGLGTAATISSTAGGDLSGTLPSPTVAGLQGNPVASGTPSNNTVLSWNGSNWAGTPISSLTYAQQVLIPGLVGDGVTDDYAPIQAAIEAIGVTSSGTELVVASPIVNGSVYINNIVEISTSNVRLRFASPVIFGPNGIVRIQGGFSQSANGHLPNGSSISAGSTTLVLQNGTVSALGIIVGSQLTIHGNRTALGVAMTHETAYVSAVAGDTVTLRQGIQNTYQYSYTNSYGIGNGWNTVLTEVAVIFGTPMTGGNTRGSSVLTVSTTASLVVGQFLYISDGDVCWNPTNNTYQTTNYQHREIAEVKAIVDGTHVQISHALHHTYDISTYAQISVLDPVINSEVTGLRATFTGGVSSGSAKYAIQVQYAVNCRVMHVEIVGTGPQSSAPWGDSWFKEAVRFYVAYLCVADDIDIRDPARTDSGCGYGLSLYAATYCTARNIRATTCRHSVLLFDGRS